jgi:hypothetical protein
MRARFQERSNVKVLRGGSERKSSGENVTISSWNSRGENEFCGSEVLSFLILVA